PRSRAILRNQRGSQTNQRPVRARFHRRPCTRDGGRRVAPRVVVEKAKRDDQGEESRTVRRRRPLDPRGRRLPHRREPKVLAAEGLVQRGLLERRGLATRLARRDGRRRRGTVSKVKYSDDPKDPHIYVQLEIVRTQGERIRKPVYDETGKKVIRKGTVAS